MNPSVPPLKLADPYSGFDQHQNITRKPSGMPMTPEQHTQVPTELPCPVSSSASKIETGHEKNSLSKKESEPKTCIAIAISGSPSSGKSTLAYLLALVFEAATLPDTGFAGAQTFYPRFNAKVVESSKRKGSIAKVTIIDQKNYLKDVNECPIIEWRELNPYTPVIEVMRPKIGVERVLASARGVGHLDRYWEEAYNTNIGTDPDQISGCPGSEFPQKMPPMPIRIPKLARNIDCRGAIAWRQFREAVCGGIIGHNVDGILDTEKGRDTIKAYLSQTDPNTLLPLVDSRKIEPFRERIREWIRAETALNDMVGFRGRAVRDGSLRSICIIDGQLLFLQTHPVQDPWGKSFMHACDVKLFLPTLETEAIQRRFSQRKYMDPPQGNRKPDQPWMYEGYFCEAAWKEFLSEHEWLFEGGDVTNRGIVTSTACFDHEIHVRDFYSAHLGEEGHKYEGRRWNDETLDWAIRTILFQLSMNEAIARQLCYTQKLKTATTVDPPRAWF